MSREASTRTAASPMLDSAPPNSRTLREPRRCMTGETLQIEINPQVPPELGRLHELAANLRFTWHRPTRALISALDPDLWLEVRSNPKLFLRCVAQARLDRAATDGAGFHQ